MSTTAAPELIDALILIIDDDESTTQSIRNSLSEFKNVKVFHDGESALTFCRARAPDLVLLDVKMPSLDGWAICKEIREMSLLSQCPIIFMSADETTETELKSWEAGGNDFLRKPIVMPALKMRIMSHLTSHWHIEITNRLYHTDILTGLNNRYYFNKHIKEQIAYAERYDSDLSLLLIDINHFTEFNELYGHANGDRAVKRIANVLKQNVGRKPDSVSRYAGEEFTVLLPGTNELGAQSVAQRINNAVNDLNIKFDNEQNQQLSISIGVSSLSAARKKNLDLFNAADQNLLQVKNYLSSPTKACTAALSSI